jgi:hypothetical protein
MSAEVAPATGGRRPPLQLSLPALNDSTWCIRLFIRQTTKAAPTDNNAHVDGSGTTVKVPLPALNEKSASVIPLGVFDKLIVEKFPE